MKGMELDHEIEAVEREIERLELLGAGRGRQPARR